METKITEYRKKVKLTQQNLADLADVSRQTIISLEQGKYNPSLELAYKISKILKAKKIEDIFLLE